MENLVKMNCLFADQTTLQGLWYFTGLTTAAAAASYIFTKDTYQLIKQRKDIKKKNDS